MGYNEDYYRKISEIKMLSSDDRIDAMSHGHVDKIVLAIEIEDRTGIGYDQVLDVLDAEIEVFRNCGITLFSK